MPTKEEKLALAQARSAQDMLILLATLSQPLSRPKWVTGDTWALIGLACVMVGLGVMWIWAIPLLFGIAVLYGASKRKEREMEEWESTALKELQRLLVWTTHNRNALAQKTGYVYEGAMDDDNDPANWVQTGPAAMGVVRLTHVIVSATGAPLCGASHTDASWDAGDTFEVCPACIREQSS